MPIALLLQKPFATLSTLLAGAKALAPWAGIANTESLVLQRIRGAFLVRWFGRSVPRVGPYTSVSISNRAELTARLTEVASAGSPTAGATSLTNPAAALAGIIGGSLLSPVGQLAGLSLLLRFGRFSFATLGFALLWLVGAVFTVGMFAAPGATGVIAVAALAGLGGAGTLLGFLAFRAYIDGVLSAAAAAVHAMNAATQLFGLLVGRRTAVRNPLVGAVLALLDRLGVLAAQLLGAVAFVIDRVGPRLIPTALTLVAIRRAITTTCDALGLGLDTMVRALRRLTDGGWAITSYFVRLMVVVRQVMTAVVDKIGAGIDITTTAITHGIDELKAQVRGYLTKVDEYMRKLFKEHPTVKTLLDLIAIIEARTKAAPKQKQPGLFDKVLPKVELPDPTKLLDELPTPVTPTWAAIEREAARPRPGGIDRLQLELKAYVAVAEIADRPSIFAKRREGLRDSLVQNRAQLGALTDVITTLVGGFLTPALWSELAPRVEPVVDEFAKLVYGDVPAPPTRPLPVRRADEPVSVRPVIRKLRLRSADLPPAELRALRDSIVKRLDDQTYAVAPTTWGR